MFIWGAVMGDRFLIGIFILVIFVVPGVLSIIKPELMYKTSATYVYPKTPSKDAIKRFKVSGYFFVFLGITLVIMALLGGFKGT
jgi:hypothetical protein